MKDTTPLASALSLVTLAATTFASGTLVEVAQESSPGAGDFDANVLGYISAVDSPMSVVDHYDYGNTTYGGTNPLPQTDTGLLFLHRRTLTGDLSLVSVLDRAGGSSSRGDTRIEISGDPDGVTWMVQDEPHGAGAPTDLYSPMGTSTPASSFTANQHWGQGGDGWALGFLDGPWEVTVAFDSTIDGQPVSGLCCWKAVSEDGAEIVLALQDQRRVRLRGATGTGFGFCDGTGAAAPCGNVGGTGRGCGNSYYAEGAGLAGFGVASVSADSLTLVATDTTPVQPGLFFQGDTALNGGNGVPFGDGLRAAGDNVRRLEARTADGGGFSCTTVPIGAAGGVSPGDTKFYQMWYRDPTISPCGSGFNLTSGLELTWEP